MMQRQKQTSAVSMMGAIALSLSTIACAPVAFDAATNASFDDGQNDLYSNFFKLGVSQIEFSQPQLEANDTQVSFQVVLPNGSHIADLKKNDFDVLENGRAIPGFQLKSNSKKIEQAVDIVFAVDITGSMEPTIESAKMRLINFVNKSRANGHHTRMCLVTFGDFTVKKCDRFYDNNPKDPKTEPQVKELISEISKLQAIRGINDPGGYDLNENPMRALIDAAGSPWKDKSERFLIMITDDGFLYSPGNSGDVGSLAPRYTEVLNALRTSQMKVFAATPSLSGYNQRFGGSPGIVEASLGEWFNFNGLINGTITLDTILNRIIDRVQTNYLVEYRIDETMGFDPTVPLADRKIEITLKDGRTASVIFQTVQSNLPNGRAAYKKKFKIASGDGSGNGTGKRISKKSVKVLVNGVRSQSFVLNDEGEVEFEQAPPALSKIEAYYQYESIKDSLNISNIFIKGDLVQSEAEILITLNDIPVAKADYSLVKTLEGDYSIRLSEQVMSESDPYRIREFEGLKVRVILNAVTKLQSKLQ